jgi:predicted cupin superfamily sugar epimerase
MATAREIIDKLQLQPHPEGGWYRQTFEDEAGADGRAHSTAIYFLLEGGKLSAWHRIDAAEAWHWYAGAPLVLAIAEAGGTARELRLGPDVLAGEEPQGVVPRGWWQSARSTGDWSLLGCTVAPGFQFSRFELAPEGWAPGAA